MNSTRQGLLAPSLLSADFAQLANEIKSVEQVGADWLHFDIMDGHFVPNLTFGAPIVKALRPLSSLPFDCHLMVSEPEKWIELFARAGANWITVHAEATPHLNRVLNQIHDAGCKAGVSLNPATPVTAIEEVLDWVDLVLVMSVNPGFGGQKFISNALPKIEKVAHLRSGRPFLIQVDGGVDSQNIQRLYRAGADVFVAGSSVFGAADRKRAIHDLKSQLS